MKKIKVILTVLAMVLLSGFAAGQLSAEERTLGDVLVELSRARKSVSYIEKRDNLDTEATRKVKALEKEYEELRAKDRAELERLKQERLERLERSAKLNAEQRRLEGQVWLNAARAEELVKEVKNLGWRYNCVLELVGVNSSFFQTDVNTVGLFRAHGNILVLN